MKTCFLILLVVLLAGCGPIGCGSNSSLNRKSVQTPTPQPATTLTPTATTIASPTPTATSRPGTTPTATGRSNPTPTVTPVPSASLDTPLHDAPISASIPVPGNAYGLNVYSVEGLQCPIRRFPLAPGQNNLIIGPSDNLVLATNRLTYSADQIQAMRNYLTEIYGNTASITTSYLVPPPSTLRWVPGAPSGACGLTLQVSNVGTTTVQIDSLGVQLTGTPQPNAYAYRALDACSVAGVGCGGPSIAGDCSAYVAEVSLDPKAAVNAVFAEKPQQGANEAGPCLVPILHPRDTLYFHLRLDSPGPEPYSTAPYIYTVKPILTVTDANGSVTSTVPAMAATIAFTSQISRYGLQHQQDTTFALCDGFTC